MSQAPSTTRSTPGEAAGSNSNSNSNAGALAETVASGTDAEPLFPPGHPFRTLHRANFDAVRCAMAGLIVSAIWIDSDQDPRREGFRPSYSSLFGPGSSNLMPFISTYLSTGPGSERAGRDGSNVVVFPRGIDRSLIAWGERVGLLGPHAYVDHFTEMKPLAEQSGRKIYSIDDLGDGYDDLVSVSPALSRWLNAKDDLASVSRFAPPEIVKDMYDATLEDFVAMHRPGRRVFLKTCNTESAGAGVFIARDAQEYQTQLETIRARQKRYDLNRALVVQSEIVGENRSFQLFLDPRRPDVVQVVALTDQLVEADGKTYKSSINHAITPERVEALGPMLVDMVERVRARFPDVFGFLMCDYFQTAEGPVIIDPGIRPTGNTATAMAFHLARKLSGGRDHFVSLMKVPTGVAGMTFDRFAAAHEPLCDPRNITRAGTALLPWGWNHVQGFGMIIGVAPDEASFRALEARVRETRYV